MRLSDLWEIYDWDEKWEYLQHRKSLLYQKYLIAKVPEEYFVLLEESSKEIEVQDLYDHFLVHFAGIIEQGQKRKRAQKRDIYSTCKKNGLLPFANVIHKKEHGLSFSNLYVHHFFSIEIWFICFSIRTKYVTIKYGSFSRHTKCSA